MVSDAGVAARAQHVEDGAPADRLDAVLLAVRAVGRVRHQEREERGEVV